MNNKKYKLIGGVQEQDKNKQLPVTDVTEQKIVVVPTKQEEIPIPTQVSVVSAAQTVQQVVQVVKALPSYGKEISPDLIKKAKPQGSIINIDNLKNVSGKKNPRIQIPKRSGYRKFFKWAFRGFKVVVGTAALIVSLGASGDTLTDILFLIIDVAFLVYNVGSILILTVEQASATKWITDIYNLEWIGSPDDIKNKMIVIFKEVDEQDEQVGQVDGQVVKQVGGQSAASQIYGVICDKYMTVLDSFAAMFASLISTMIPEDPGVIRIIIELIISEGMMYLGKSPFEALKWIYNKIPKALTEVLMNQKNLSKFFFDMLIYLKGLLPSKDDTTWQRVKKHGTRSLLLNLTVLVPGVNIVTMPLMPVLMAGNVLAENSLVAEEVSQFIDSHIAPHCDSYAALIMRIIPMVFATTLIFSRCAGAEIEETIVLDPATPNPNPNPKPIQATPLGK
ncbi:MAG: DnaJ domain protein [Barrevirus sp.]|uniref:DnaJ domain protein n=1 Tax=Barrevirus sp. TaxID=2487763 RepID=A0A3G4ZQR9_9VIRU|nr:MAG: DnaJ domain protein [Barrevirus sp.]